MLQILENKIQELQQKSPLIFAVAVILVYYIIENYFISSAESEPAQPIPGGT